jgi:hypothetical protein
MKAADEGEDGGKKQMFGIIKTILGVAEELIFRTDIFHLPATLARVGGTRRASIVMIM